MSKENKIINESANYSVRFKPNHHYLSNKFTSISLDNFKSSQKSVTDKEAYRVNLSTLRGQLASGVGAPDVGNYSIPAGKKYDKRYDFSYINRPDITIVELDSYIDDLKSSLKNYDDSLNLKIKDELEKAESKAEEMKKAELQKAETKSNKTE